jgi:hypothetical protein
MPAADRDLLFRAAVLVSGIRLGLWVLSFNTLRRILGKFQTARQDSKDLGLVQANRIIWAVITASRYIPKATCLTQALAGQVLLARYGYASTVHLGVQNDAGDSFRAHAWLEREAQIVIGGSGMSGFTPLTVFGSGLS